MTMPEEVSDGDDQVRVTHLVDRSARDVAQDRTDHGEMSEKVRALYEVEAFGEDMGQRSQLERELDAVRDEKDSIRAEIRRLESEFESLGDREKRIESSLSNLSSKEDKFDGALEMLEQQLYGGAHVDPKHPGVKRAAGLASSQPEQVIQTLKDRNPGVPHHAFVQKLHTNKSWDGCTEEEAQSPEDISRPENE